MKPLTEEDVRRASRMAANMTDAQHKALLLIARPGKPKPDSFNSVVAANLRSRELIRSTPDGGYGLTPDAEVLLRFLSGEAIDL